IRQLEIAKAVAHAIGPVKFRLPWQPPHVASDKFHLQFLALCGRFGFGNKLPREIQSCHPATTSRQLQRVTPIAARRVEQALFCGEDFFKKIHLSACLVGSDAFAPTIIGHAVEEMLEPIAPVSHLRAILLLARSGASWKIERRFSGSISILYTLRI